MKNILLTGQLIWEALQAESGDFDVLWEVLQSQKIQGYITQNDLDTLYRQIAQEQDVGIAFSLINQLQRVLLVYSPSHSHPIDIEVNNRVYPHSVAVDLTEGSVLSLHGFLERHALNMLYTNGAIADGSDAEVGIAMQEWYRKWRQSGFDMLWLIPVMLTLALQSMPFFQKVIADLFEQLGDGQAPQPPEVAQKIRRSPSLALPPGERSPSIPVPRLPNRNPSQAEPSPPSSTDEGFNSPDLRGNSLRYPLRSSEPSTGEKTSAPRASNLQLLTVPRSPQLSPTEVNPINRAIELQPAVPSITPQDPSIAPSPISAPEGNEQPNIEPTDDPPLVPTPVFGPPQSFPPLENPETPIPNPTVPSIEPLPLVDPPPSTPPADDIQPDIAGDGVMNIPDPLTDPSSIADPYFPNPPPSPVQPDLPNSDAQSTLPSMPNDWSGYELELGQLGYEPGYNLTIVPAVGVPQSGRIGTISVDSNLIEMAPGGLRTDLAPVIDFRF